MSTSYTPKLAAMPPPGRVDWADRLAAVRAAGGAWMVIAEWPQRQRLHACGTASNLRPRYRDFDLVTRTVEAGGVKVVHLYARLRPGQPAEGS